MIRAGPCANRRNHDASRGGAEREPRTGIMSTPVRQATLAAVRRSVPSSKAMSKAIAKRNAILLTAPARHCPADTLAFLTRGKDDVFPLVTFARQRSYHAQPLQIGPPTRELIETALRFGMRYYLPHHPCHGKAEWQVWQKPGALRPLTLQRNSGEGFSNAVRDKYFSCPDFPGRFFPDSTHRKTKLPFLNLQHGSRKSNVGIARVVGLSFVFFWFFIGGIIHFVATDVEASIVPPFIPWPVAAVLVSGVFELVGAFGLLIPSVRRAAGVGLFLLTLAVTPAHFYMLQRPELFHVPLWALWLRLPIQVALLGLIHWSTRRPDCPR